MHCTFNKPLRPRVPIRLGWEMLRFETNGVSLIITITEDEI